MEALTFRFPALIVVLLATACTASFHDVRTPPAQYQGPLTERVRITKMDGDRGVLWDAYIDGGVLHGTGYNQEERREQKYAYALTEIQKIELERDDTAKDILTALGVLLLASFALGL